MDERPRGRELGNGSRQWPDDPDDEANDRPPIIMTFFPDYAAATKREQLLDLTDLARRIEITTGPDKAHLPWLKCARFGDIPTAKASLRWDGNLLAITGIEADYDGEAISFDAAQDKLSAAGILCIVYTSPSHTEDTPRWRVLCPLSEEYPPDRRDAFLARLNGLFGGVFSRESWTRSQSYYFGSVNSNPSHRVAVLAGNPIDQAVELDDRAIGKPVKPEAATRPAYPAADPSKITDKRVNGKIEALLDNIRAAQDQQKHYTLWDNALSIGGYLHLTDWTDELAVGKCLAALPSAKDWNLARRTAAEAIAKGRLKPLTLEDRPEYATRRRPPEPPPEWETQHPAPEPHPTGQPGNGAAPEPPPVDAARDTDARPDGQTAEAEDADTGDGQGDAPRELYGPPTLDDLSIADLVALDEVVFGRIVEAKASLLGITQTYLKAARSAAKTAAAKAVKEAKAREKEAAKEREQADKREAKAKERQAKAAERQARLDVQKNKPLVDDDEDPLHKWSPPDPTTRPEITVAPGERPAIADAALVHMKAGRAPFYQRGIALVRVCLVKLKTAKEETVLVPAIESVPKPMMLRAMSLTAKWLAYNRELELVQIDPPSDLGDHILSMVGEWPFATLRGVISTQTMRHDGSLLTEPGYDPRTGLLLFNPPKLPPMPTHPTKADALEALAYLSGLLSEFDFAKDEHGDDGVSRSGAMSMLMTPVLRGMMEAAPLHAISKPDAGSGGSYLQDLMSSVALGQRCPTISLTLRNDEENEKRLSSAARLGLLIIAIDNFTGTLMGDFLCQLVSQPMPMIRLLGVTEMVTIPNNHCVVANGINITIGTDAIRRVVLIGLDPNTENPADRSFTRDPVAEVLADRGPAVAAVLTIARAYRLAGMPGKLPPRPSFEVWSDNVRSALVWLGLPDCDESLKTARATDPHTSKLAAVMGAWATELRVGHGYRVSELVTEASEYAPSSNNRLHPLLWDALFDVAATKQGQLDPAALGNWLRDHKNRVIGSHKLLNDTADKQRPRWMLVPR